MGYYSHCTSDVTFDKQISEDLLKEIRDNLNDLTYHADPSTAGLGDGYDSGKAYYLEDDAKELVKYLAREGVTASGSIVVVGEESPDIWRLVFKDGSVAKENVKVIWPDGTEYRTW